MRRLRSLALLLALASLPTGCLSDDSDPVAPVTPSPADATVEGATFAPAFGIDLAAAGWTRTSTGLYYRVTRAGAEGGAPAANGQRVSVGYTGWLASGQAFQTSSYAFDLGRGQVIAGWDQGIVGMRVGERRRLLIPAALGYGEFGSGPIPPNAVLVFDVELLAAT